MIHRPREDRPQRQGIFHPCDPPGVKAALGAGIALRDLHTAKTAVKLHFSLLFQWPDVWFRVPGDNHYDKIISSLDGIVYCLFGNF